MVTGRILVESRAPSPGASGPRIKRPLANAILLIALTAAALAQTHTTVRHYKERIDDSNLEVDENSVLVLKNCGPKGYPGMAEVGNMSLPAKLLKRGITDMVRISDARMSGTAYGTVVLHVCPEAAVGGNLALVRDGDFIELDVESRRLHLEVSQEDLERRRMQWQPPVNRMQGGYQQLYVERVTQANMGADLDFLTGCRGADIPRESH